MSSVTTKLSTATGAMASNPITSKLARPIINLLDDFWFYQFHSTLYPEFVQQFTSQVDLMGELRIKPSFLNFDIQISSCESQNQLYANQTILQPRAPASIFALLSLKDIYTINACLVVGQFLALKFLK